MVPTDAAGRQHATDGLMLRGGRIVMVTARALSRRQVIGLVAAVAVGIAVSGVPADAQQPLKIGIIGAGRIGGTMAEHWVKAGHEVFLSSRHPESLKDLVSQLGPKAHAGTPKEAAAFGDVVFIAVPYSALPDIGRELAPELKGKVVVNASNPIPRRDGPVAEEAQKKGAGLADAELLPGTRVARAFTFPGAATFKSEAFRAGDRIAVAVAADDTAAMAVASQLVRDAGFEPVQVGPLAKAREFQPGSALFGKVMTAPEMKQALGIAP
jgi:8-hydroxy-5-deazaflavin:NADPH oxidoreductase